jgi:vacuolar-type H+-ATPase subunit I/STV1
MCFSLAQSNTEDPTSAASMELRRGLLACQGYLRQINRIRAAATRVSVPLPIAETPVRVLASDRDVPALFSAWVTPVEEEVQQHEQFLDASRREVARMTEFLYVIRRAIDSLEAASHDGSGASRLGAGASKHGTLRGLVGTSSAAFERAVANASEDEDAWLFDDRNHLSGDSLAMQPMGGSAQQHRADGSGTAGAAQRFAATLRRAGSAFAPDVSVTSLYGLIAESARPMLERMLLRALRGNVLIATEPVRQPVVDPTSLQRVRKCVFRLLFPPGSQLPERARRICAALGAHLYAPPAQDLDALRTAHARLRAERRARLAAVRQTRQALRRTLYAAVWGVDVVPRAVARWRPGVDDGDVDDDSSDDEDGEASALDAALGDGGDGDEFARAPPAHALAEALRAGAGVSARDLFSPVPALSSLTGSGSDGSGGPLAASPLNDWFVALQQEQALLSVLSLARGAPAQQSRSIVGWVPSKRLGDLTIAVRSAGGPASADASVVAAVVEELAPADAGCRSPPPTLIETNAMTALPQAVVDTYGVPKYQEVNPGLFTVVTFPFLFGVMYGDIFHGGCLLLTGLTLLLLQGRHDALLARGRLSSALAGLHSARWMLFLMGLFACYMGFIYNDCASIPLRLFSSQFEAPAADHGTLTPRGGVYAFGIDPAWYHSAQELAFLNSYKMKMAVIIGVIHMTLGIVLGAFNHTQFRAPENILLETVPRVVFMLATFGYMCFMILYKFTVDWVGEQRAAPNLIQTMIKMFLQPGVVEPSERLFDGQAGVQYALVVLAMLCVPVLFLAQPFYRRHQWRRLHPHTVARAQEAAGEASGAVALLGARRGAAAGYDSLTDASEEEWAGAGAVSALLSGVGNGRGRDRDSASDSVAAADGHRGAGGAHGAGGDDPEVGHTDPRNPHYSFSDDLIHQAIHAIEFVLGAVSNTASYLRLWALSLAHAQLASVFWTKMVVEYGLAVSPLAAVVGVAGWAAATAGVLLAMDTLECFLHALRLHWVEFQNKFYAASGTAFAPFVLPVQGIAFAAPVSDAEAKSGR